MTRDVVKLHGMADVFLDIVDQEDHIVGREQRSIIHGQGNGLWHRKIHVWFITPKNKIIFQHRAIDKETFPNLLDATVGGHVELGQSYNDAALMEVREETGLTLVLADLVPLTKLRVESFDKVTERYNNCFRQIYGYVFEGALKDLQVEDGQSQGFVAVDYADLLSLTPQLAARICPSHTQPNYMAIYKQLLSI